MTALRRVAKAIRELRRRHGLDPLTGRLPGSPELEPVKLSLIHRELYGDESAPVIEPVQAIEPEPVKPEPVAPVLVKRPRNRQSRATAEHRDPLLLILLALRVAANTGRYDLRNEYRKLADELSMPTAGDDWHRVATLDKCWSELD